MNLRMITMSITAFGFICASIAACSSSSTTGSGSGFSCPAAGYKACPNDEGTTQLVADDCNRCLKQAQDLTACDPNLSKVNCDASGKSVGHAPIAACGTQLQAYEECALKKAD